MIRMLAIDMDGTCLNEKSKISAQTLQALEQAAKEGICVVPTTGRALSCLINWWASPGFGMSSPPMGPW